MRCRRMAGVCLIPVVLELGLALGLDGLCCDGAAVAAAGGR